MHCRGCSTVGRRLRHRRPRRSSGGASTSRTRAAVSRSGDGQAAERPGLTSTTSSSPSASSRRSRRRRLPGRNRGSPANGSCHTTSPAAGTTAGGNAMYLAVEGLQRGYADPRWGGYRQIQEAGGHVRKGEKGTPIMYVEFYRRVQVRDERGKPVLDGEGRPTFTREKRARKRQAPATVRPSSPGWATASPTACRDPTCRPSPLIALRQVEVLRDGAAAQYGSDAHRGRDQLRAEPGRCGRRYCCRRPGPRGRRPARPSASRGRRTPQPPRRATAERASRSIPLRPRPTPNRWR